MVGMMMAMTSICVAFIAMPPITSAEQSPSPLRKISLHEPLAMPESSTVVAPASCIGGRYPKITAARWRIFVHQPRAFIVRRRPPSHGKNQKKDMDRSDDAAGKGTAEPRRGEWR